MSITVDQYRATTSEHQLQALVLQHLATKGKRDQIAFAIPNAGKRTLRTGARMKAEGLLPGAPDLCIMMAEGRICWLELKSRRGTQTPEQKGFQARCARLGHVYGVAKTFDQAIAFLTEVGALRP